MHSMLLVLVLSAAPHDDLLDAADTFERALTLVGRQQRSCQDVLAQNLRQSIRDVRAAAGKRGTTSESVQGLRLFAAGMVLASGLSTCPSQVTELVSEGVADLNRAFDGFASRETLEVERPARRRARDFDDEDDARPARLRRGASLGRVRVVMDSPSPIDGSPSVLLELSQVVFDAPGSASFGVICRSANGRARTDWSTTEAVSVAAGVLEAPASFSLRYSTLARADVSQGRFVCHVAVFEGRSSTEHKAARAFVVTAEQLVRRLVSLVPPAKTHLTSFHGVYAPHAALRPLVTAPPPKAASSSASLSAKKKKRRTTRRLDWASLHQHTFGVDVLRCPCGGRRRIIALHSTRKAAEERLTQLGHHLPPRRLLPPATAQPTLPLAG
jgi:hypothetical protein